MNKFFPDYRHIEAAAYNRRPSRLPLYEHAISGEVIKQLTGTDYAAITRASESSYKDKVEAFRQLADFHIKYGYDTISVECCTTALVQGGRGLCGQAGPVLRSMADVRSYPWHELAGRYQEWTDEQFKALKEGLPPGMKAVGGVGNGIFELAQDFVPFTHLAYLQFDDPDAYELLWRKIGDAVCSIWEWFLTHHGDAFAVCRFGDDLGFRSATLLSPEDIRQHIIPQYARIIALIHQHNKPFLLHSCGQIHEVMDDLIDVAGIDAKHSNEDAIDIFDVWLERYGARIGNFGGVEMNELCLKNPVEIKQYVTRICRMSEAHGGVAIGSGNQISSYVPPEGFIAMAESVREYRGE